MQTSSKLMFAYTVEVGGRKTADLKLTDLKMADQKLYEKWAT